MSSTIVELLARDGESLNNEHVALVAARRDSQDGSGAKMVLTKQIQALEDAMTVLGVDFTPYTKSGKVDVSAMTDDALVKYRADAIERYSAPDQTAGVKSQARKNVTAADAEIVKRNEGRTASKRIKVDAWTPPTASKSDAYSALTDDVLTSTIERLIAALSNERASDGFRKRTRANLSDLIDAASARGLSVPEMPAEVSSD